MKRREFPALSGRTSRPSGATVVARRLVIRPSPPPSGDTARLDRLFILLPPIPFCSGPSSFWAVRRLKASQPGLGCRHTGDGDLAASMDYLRKAGRVAGPLGLAW